MLYPFLCKRFKNGEWEILGVVHASGLSNAWAKAIDKWKSVTSVYDLFSCD